MVNVAVLGAGVIGLTIAHELARAGHRVQVVADRAAVDSVSGVAAALWFPHDVEASEAVLRSARLTYERLADLAVDPATGVQLRIGTVLRRGPDPDWSWTRALPEHQTAVAAPCTSGTPGAVTGIECTVPLAQTDRYLRWLDGAVRAAGVRFRALSVSDVRSVVEATGCDVLVVAAGLASSALLGDDEPARPVRGQVVRVANPGLVRWVTDDDNPAGLTYVIPRGADVVCGGTGEIDPWDERVDPGVERAILDRAVELVPALRGQPVLSRAVGLRPVRRRVRLEVVVGHDVPVVACYGHGGAGFTLSWGDASRVVGLLDER